jgi:SAM-dependent methyltransferase
MNFHMNRFFKKSGGLLAELGNGLFVDRRKSKLKSIAGITHIDLGCGKEKDDGYFGIDRVQLPGVDLVLDLEIDKLPFAENSVDHVVTYHALEHLNSYEHIVNEVFRVLKPGAQFFVCVPYGNNSLNEANIYHPSRFNEHSFRFFSNEETCDALPERIWKFHYARSWGLAGSDNSQTNCNFRTIKIEMDYMRSYKCLSDSEKEDARLKFNNVVHNICFYLQAIKGASCDVISPPSDDEIIVPPRRKWMIENSW